MGRYASKEKVYVGRYPVLKPIPKPATLWRGMNFPNYKKGFVGDGDFILLNASGNTITYYNSAGATVWSKHVTSVNVSADNYCGVFLDPVDNLIYGVAHDVSSPYTFYTFSINAAGAITNIGNFVHSSYSSPALNMDDPTAAYSTTLQRQVDGTGDLLMNVRSGTGSTTQTVISSSTGLELAHQSYIPTIPSGSIGTIGVYYGTPFTTKSGYAIQGFDFSSGNGNNYISAGVDVVVFNPNVNKYNGALFKLPQECLGGSNYALSANRKGINFTNWGGVVTPCYGENGGAWPFPFIGFDQDDFDNWVAELLEIAGIL